MMVKNFTVKEFSEIFHSIESTKNKTLKVDPNLERNTTVQSRHRKYAHIQCKLYEKKAVSTIDSF